jgi:hypothetical protein
MFHYFSANQESLADAAHGCNALNMSLLAIESQASMQAYLPLLSNKLPPIFIWICIA